MLCSLHKQSLIKAIFYCVILTMRLHVIPRCFAVLSRHMHGKISNRIICYEPLHTKSAPTGQNSPSERLSRSFGHEEVSPTEKRKKVQTVFSEVASKYDLMNDVMSMGIHRFWKDHFIHTLSPTPGMKLLDVAGGTGDIAFRFLQASLENESDLSLHSVLDEKEEKLNLETDSHVVVLDMNDKMLSICRQKAEDARLNKYLTCIQGNAELLPFRDNCFDVYTIAFGIRNVVHIDQALSEAYRVLKKGGRFLCLEFSEVENPTFYRMYDWYSQEIIPVIGQLIAGNWKAYQYLVESIQKFPPQEEFVKMIEDAGFCLVSYENLFNGIAAIHSGYKL